MELSQNIGTSNEPETKGFDLSSGNTWIYPENYPIREYQYNIVKTSLYDNTLVCLPTGLGKTFIAAVVMYNFWRWYPFGKIVFLAPTKPLVNQQIEACYNIMGIPNVDMIQLTGATVQKNREIVWSKKKIIFATPQVFHNDLEKSIVPSHLIKCVVVDEAHKALRKHSYCECIRILSTQNQYFRVLALSATPGNKIDNVHEVIQNLLISHLELRDENSTDIIPYINQRKVDVILVPLSNELATFKEKYITIMDPHVKTLMQFNILRGHTANISRGRIFHLLKEFKTKTDKSGNYNQIMKTLNILLTMYHAYELMIRHGLRAFYKFYQNHSDKFWIQNEYQLHELLCDIEIYLGPFPDIYPNGDISEVTTELVFGHNKFHKLKELLERHFGSDDNDQKDTRAIIFVEFRDIVNEVYIMLLQLKPIIRPQMFVGQAGQKQKQQQKALEDFRSNRVNVLISTSIGEEGLDVGEVDLIICFDVSQHSPTRLVQRMGRTGRKRDGHIIILVTDGKEHENLKSTLSRRDSLNNKILNTSNIFTSLYQNNPRMIPNQFNPECHKIHITILPKTSNEKDWKKKKGVKRKNEALVTKQKGSLLTVTQKSADQPSMTKYFTNSKCNEQKINAQVNTRNIFTATSIHSSNAHNIINANDVKLLSDDKAGIDFLTLCAVKKSQEEMSSEIVRKMDTTYIPIPKPIMDFFNFVVPDVQTFDCLSFLSTKFNSHMPTQQHKSREDEIIHNENDYLNNDDSNCWYTIRNERNVDGNEVKFEDILDESSDSSVTILHVDKKTVNFEVDAFNANKVPISITKDNEETTKHSKLELSNNIPDNTKPSIFEDILDDSFSSIDDMINEDTTPQNVLPNSLNIFAENAEKLDVTYESAVNSLGNVNTDRFNRKLSISVEPADPNQINKQDEFAGNIDEMQDLDFSDDPNEFACETKKNKSVSNSKQEESHLSITQAIEEIAKTKLNSEKLTRVFVNEEESSDDDDSSGWISVNTKHEIENDKRNARSGRKIQLSNLGRNSTVKQTVHTTKQHLDFQENSDEDFMFTEANAKKFDELESSYFCHTMKHSENDNGYLGETSKSVNPCVTSALTVNKCSGLSLQRNKHSNTSVFEALSKFKIKQKDHDLLISNVNTSKQTSSLGSATVQKGNREKQRRYKKRNEFIDDEAEVESDVSSDESISIMDEDLENFVSYTQNVEDQVDMQAHYLKTIKSPIKRPGAFYFKKPLSPDPDIEIYSQPRSEEQEEDSYLDDSFCVSEADEPSAFLHNDSILERAKREVKRNKRKHLCSDNDGARVKKRKNILNNSVSSEDEIELLRMQLQEDRLDDDWN